MNILMIMSDEHSDQVMGCSGHPVAKTPAIDQLAREGTLFANCYTPCPLCVPTRASLFTSQYVNKLGTWDNATPYDGKIRGLSQYLIQHGYDMTSIGKLDFHPEGAYNGLEAIIPSFREEADIGCLFRESDQARPKTEQRFKRIGITDKTTYDDKIRDLAIQWLKDKKRTDSPWFLYVGFTNPHFPFYVRKKYWDYYDKIVKEIPEVAKEPFKSLNEPLLALRHHFRGDVADEKIIRKAHLGYYALVSQLDYNIGQILNALEEQGLTDDTLIIYTSDHGEQLGHHGLWWKCCMFEESVHIPLIMKGPAVKKGAKVDTLVSLMDIFPTICQALNIPVPKDIVGQSLMNLAYGREDIKRDDFVFSEYHAHGMPVGMYMIRWKNWKYVYYAGYKPQLFDLNKDNREINDLAEQAKQSEEIQRVLVECERKLRTICNPEEVNERAKAFQSKMRNMLGITEYNEDEIKKSRTAFHPEYL